MRVAFQTEFDLNDFANLCGGRLEAAEGSGVSRGICTDSREADAETAFVALRGERVDGHDYIGAALERGCRLTICERNDENVLRANASAIVVGDSERALSHMARGYKRNLPCKTVAITGSVGKTTAKEMIASVLSQKKRVYRTEGNHNSVIGMPLSVMQIARDCEYAVLEMGMSGFGEIARMSMAAEPDIAVITNIGTSHMELLGSRENICRAKMEILSGLKRGGALILNGDEPLLRGVAGRDFRSYYVSVSRTDADFYATNIRMENGCTYFDAVWNGGICRDLCMCVLGKHNVYAGLYAFAVGILSGLSAEEIRLGLLAYATVGMRQNRYRFKDITVIEDCYNASPESVRAAIDVLSETSFGRSVAVLGDMLELGIESDELHRGVGFYLAAQSVDGLFTIGKGGAQIAYGALCAGMNPSEIHMNVDRDDIAKTGDALISYLRPNDTVLFKASRSVRLERLIEYIKGNY